MTSTYKIFAGAACANSSGYRTARACQRPRRRRRRYRRSRGREGAERGEGRGLEHDARRHLPGEAGRLRGGDGGAQGRPAGAQGGTRDRQSRGSRQATPNRRRSARRRCRAPACFPARRRSPTLHPTRRRPALTLATAALALRIRRGGRRSRRARRAQPRRRVRHLPSPCGDYRKSFAKRRRRRRRRSCGDATAAWRPRWRASCRPMPQSGSAHCMPSR